MPNRNIDDLEKQDKAANAVIAGAATFVGAVAAGITKKSIDNHEINKLEHQNQMYRDEPFGKIRHRKKIKDNNEKIKKRRG